MRLRYTLITLGFVILFAAPSFADSFRIPLPPMPPPPPVPDFMKAPPSTPDVEFVVPPPPPFIRVEVSQPDYWFYDDGRDSWFYYEKGHKRRYVRKHRYHEDGKHFYGEGKKWHKVEMKHAQKKGWMKKHEVKKKVTVKKKKWYRFWDDD